MSSDSFFASLQLEFKKLHWLNRIQKLSRGSKQQQLSN